MKVSKIILVCLVCGCLTEKWNCYLHFKVFLMKRFFILFVVFAVGYFFWLKGGSSERLVGFDTPAVPYMIVYGRDSCGFTRSMKRNLKSSGIAYSYRKVDDADTAANLHNKMESLGISTRRYDLPVVEVNARILIRPDVSVVADLFNK